MAAAGVAPRVMGVGPIPAVQKVMAKTGLKITDMDVIELNGAFASQALAVLRALGVPDDGAHVNPMAEVIALGHPLGMSGARLALTATEELHRRKGRYAHLCTMCIGVGRGIAVILERVFEAEGLPTKERRRRQMIKRYAAIALGAVVLVALGLGASAAALQCGAEAAGGFDFDCPAF